MDTSNTWAIRERLPLTWPARSVSHCATALLETPVAAANPAWLNPRSRLKPAIRSPMLESTIAVSSIFSD